MALPFAPIALFSGIVLLSSALSVGGLNFTADTVAKVAAAPPVKTRAKPSYIARMPTPRQDDFNIAKSVPVKPAVVQMPVAKIPEPVAPAMPKYTHKVAVDAAHVRSGPKKSFPRVYTLRNGSWVNTTDTVQGWVHVTDEQGREGWIYGSLLEQGAPEAGTLAAAE